MLKAHLHKRLFASNTHENQNKLNQLMYIKLYASYSLENVRL